MAQESVESIDFSLFSFEEIGIDHIKVGLKFKDKDKESGIKAILGWA